MNKKILIGIALIGLFLIPLSSQLVIGANEKIGVSESNGAITLVTDEITVKITPEQANIFWWYGNKSNTNEMYKLQLTAIQEFTGDDDVLDSRTELYGIKYNLIRPDWDYDIVEGETEVTITLSLLGLANGANIYLIMHIYNADTEIAGTDEVVDGLSELKFDIIVEDWTFGPLAKGYAIQTYLTEVQHRHRVEVRNGTALENGTLTRTMQFDSEEYTGPVAYYEWTTFANIYNSTEDLVDTIDVGTAYFDDLAAAPTEAPGFAEGLAHLWLTYPEYLDDHKMVHDPIIGVNEVETVGFSLYLLPIFGGLAVITAVMVVARKRKN
ncbi:MAG TPA: hypothetical protein VMX55_09240 [candidate division Zixibacteria bacterium]|nr:hypothetical protein [candidate division Zixibacteria bacterium]